MTSKHRLLVLASVAFAPFMLHAASDVTESGTFIAAPGPAPRDVTLPNGTFVRLGANTDGSLNAAGELILKKGSAVVIAKDDAPVGILTGGTRTTVTGGTHILSATKDSALRIITLAGEATSTASGAEPVDLKPGQTITIFPARAGEAPTSSPIVTVDLEAIAKSSRLLNAAPLPSSAQLGEAVSSQREAITEGDLSPTDQLLVTASRERGLGFASAASVRDAISQRGTGLKNELTGSITDMATLGSGTLFVNGTGDSSTITLPGGILHPTVDIISLSTPITVNADSTLSPSLTNGMTFSCPTVTIANGKTLTFSAPETVTVKNTNFVATTGATSGTISCITPATLVELDTVSLAPVLSLQLNSRTVSLKNVTFDQGRLLSRDGILNIGSVMDGAVNFVSGVKTSDNTDLTTAEGINAKVHVVNGTILQNGSPMAGATGGGAGAPIVIDRR